MEASAYLAGPHICWEACLDTVAAYQVLMAGVPGASYCPRHVAFPSLVPAQVSGPTLVVYLIFALYLALLLLLSPGQVGQHYHHLVVHQKFCLHLMVYLLLFLSLVVSLLHQITMEVHQMVHQPHGPEVEAPQDLLMMAYCQGLWTFHYLEHC